jgi:hypothetical protein
VPVPGDIVLQRVSPEKHPVDLIIALKSPHYAHCGVWIAPGRMIAASLAIGGVNLQSCSESDDEIVSLPDTFYKAPRKEIVRWAVSQLFKPYDIAAWWWSLIGRKEPIRTDRYDCSNFIGALFNKFCRPTHLFMRGTTPDDIASFIKARYNGKGERGSALYQNANSGFNSSTPPPKISCHKR